MNIVIIPPDNRVSIDGIWKTVQIDIAHINCARLDGESGVVEHVSYEGHWPEPRPIPRSEFLQEFSGAIQAWESAKTDEELHADAARAMQEAEEAAFEEELAAEAARVWGKDVYLARTQQAAESARAAHVTLGAGQSLVYQEKAAEAVAVLGMGEVAANALPDHGSAEFPLLAASVGIEADTLFDVAQIVGERAEATATALGAIERVRLTAKRAIQATETDADAKAIYEAIQWP